MPTEDTDFINANIDDCLVAIADGVIKAQSHLNAVTMQATPGLPATAYHIPKVDFELKLSLTLESKQSQNNKALVDKKGNKPLIKKANLAQHISIKDLRRLKPTTLRATPVNPSSNNSNSTHMEAVSTITGSIVSIPAYGGTPAPILEVDVIQDEANKNIIIQAQLSNINGEKLSNETVEFNLDRELSQQLNAENKLIDPQSKEGRSPHLSTQLSHSMVDTNAQGIATTILELHKSEAKGLSFAIEVFAMGLSESIIYTQSA